MKYAFTILVLLLIAVVVCPVMADDQAEPTRVAYQVGAGAGSDASLKTVVASSVGVQLTRRSGNVQEIDTDTAGAPVLSKTLALAADKNTHYLLLVSYTTTSQDISIVVHLYDVSTSKEVGQAALSGRIDLTLDTLIAQVIDKAASGIVFHASPAAADALATGTGDLTAGGADKVTVLPSGPAKPEPGSVPAQPPRRKGVSLGITSGAAPYLPTGTVGTYVTMGGLATLSVAARFPLGPGTFGAGALSGVAALHATGAVADADIVLVPIGIDTQYTLNDGGFPGVTLHVSGGPAVMSVNAGYTERVTKVIPYLIAGMTLELPFSSFMGLSVEAAWAAFFESTLPIMGFAPEVSFYVRF